MSSDQANGNGHGEHVEQAQVARRLQRLTPHPYLLARGFPPAAIQQAGWYVEPIGERYLKYGLKEHPGARSALAWFIPYRHPNGQVWFERLRLIDEQDLERFGGGKYRQPAGMKLWLYDPYLVAADDSVEPIDAVLLVEGEANTVAARTLMPSLPVIGLPGQQALSAKMAQRISHVATVFVWIDRHDPGAEENAQRIAGLLAREGADDVRQLPAPPQLMDANELMRVDFEQARGLLGEMLDAAAAVDMTPGQGTSRTTLEALWGLGAVGVRIDAVRITGRGRTAACEVDLSNGEAMVFEQITEVAGPSLSAELAACAQVVPPLKPAERLQSIALLSKLAEYTEAETMNSTSKGWGAEFLFACQQVEVDMNDQAQRWAMFEKLRSIDPWALAREYPGTNVAAHMLVPVDAAGMRYVRTGWFLAVTRQMDGAASYAQIISRMLRVGWLRRGGDGRIGARRPGGPGQTNLKFLLVREGWENLPDEVVTADATYVREEEDCSRARVNYYISGYQQGVPAVTSFGGANAPPETPQNPGSSGYQRGGERP